jgi:integrase
VETVKLLTGKDVARILNISVSLAYALMRREIPSVRFGPSVRVRPVDLEEYLQAALLVNTSVAKAEGGDFEYLPPKTERDLRMVELDDSDIEILRLQEEKVHLMGQFVPRPWKENDLVFPTTVGTSQNNCNLRKEFMHLAEKAGVIVQRFHDLRHTAASLMLKHRLVSRDKCFWLCETSTAS